MSDPQDHLQQRLDNIVSARSHAARAAAASAGDAANAAEAAPAGPRPRRFSGFILEDVQRAAALASELMRISREAGGGEAGLSAALERVEQQVAAEQAGGTAEAAAAAEAPVRGLAQHAVKLFVTHDPAARERLRLRPLEHRQPGLARSSEPAAPAAPADDAPASEEAGGGPAAASGQPSATPPEDRVSFWREDPLVNEHHEHWHLVYPTSGRPTPGGGEDLGDRHGELFAYMHEQMLARYDAERLAVNLQRVTPFADYEAPIAEGYDPGDLLLWDGGEWSAFGPRPAGVTWTDLTPPLNNLPGATIAAQQQFYQRIVQAATTGSYSLLNPAVATTIDNLGDAEEANANSPDFANNFSSYGNHHNIGHVHFAAWNNPQGNQPYGVMYTTATAVRDPIFLRWHKEVDTVFEAYKNTLPPYDFSKGPKVSIRKSAGPAGASSPDIQLLRVTGGGPVNEQAVAAALFGGSGTLPAGVELTSELRTEMKQRQVQLEDEQGNPVTETIDYLSHEDFLYAFRVENLAGTPQNLAVRVFLAPESQVEDHTAWIEMDRFTTRLTGASGIIVRRSEDSSVVRKPALKPADLEPTDEPSPKTDLQPWCDCGWPYTLLLPRGTSDGMPFRLYVMFSDGAALDMPPQPGKCTSLSYCGLKDQKYPDQEAMGYPFDRPFPQSISQTVADTASMGWTTISIRCTNLPAAAPAVTTAVNPNQIGQPQPA